MSTKFLAATVVSALTSAAAAQSTAFTYQGRLRNGSQLPSGRHNLRFRLYDAIAGAAPGRTPLF
jgi:hypothetical protein